MKYCAVLFLTTCAFWPVFLRASETQISRVPGCQLVSLARACDRMAVLVYRQLRKSNENIVFSPLSIFTDMSMVMAGAKGSSFNQIKGRMQMRLIRRDEILELFRGLYMYIKADPNAEFRSMNAMFVSENFHLQEETVNEITEAFDANVSKFVKGNPEEQINNFVANVTNGKIDNFLPKDYISSADALYVVNAIYFRAKWLHVFSEYWTRKRTFYLADNREIETTMMSQTNYFKTKTILSLGCEVVELPYIGNRFAFYILLPNTWDGLKFLEEKISSMKLESIVTDLQEPEWIDLAMPKFTLSNTFDLKDVLKQLGITKIFQKEQSNLSRLSQTNKLYLKKVRHQALIEINERGTEVAAATAGEMVEYAMPRVIEVNRPFMFVLRDKETNFNIMMGKLSRPDQ